MRIAICNRQARLAVDQDRLERLARSVLGEAGVAAGEISVAVVDDPTIHELNRRCLAHDYPTDVLSFCLDEGDDRLDGEVIVSADTAARAAAEHGWDATDELLLYVAHGLLHLVGYSDKSDDEARRMHAAEARHLAGVGAPPPPGRGSERLDANSCESAPTSGVPRT